MVGIGRDRIITERGLKKHNAVFALKPHIQTQKLSRLFVVGIQAVNVTIPFNFS